MSFEHAEHRYSLRSDIEDFYARDDYSELGPDDSASQIGRVMTSEELRAIPRYSENHRETLAQQWANGTVRPYSRLDYPTTPSSRRTSLRSSRITSTTFVPSRQDRVRYSWQSIHADEPNRPRIHVVKIVSNTATASAALPGGEAFGFSISPGGRRIAIYNSARLFILQTAALPVNISQEYSLKRRPLAIEIVDEGGTLAVLSDEHTINIYDLSHQRVRRLKTLKPDFPTYAIALSPTGGVLAAAYEGGIEVFSLAPDALTTDRRAARSAKMDKLQFSDDGSTIIGTTTRINAAATVVISVPVFPSSDDDVPTHGELKEAWCTNMLEPSNIFDASHATFLRRDGQMLNERLFSWNAMEDTFGILGTQDITYSNVDFPVTISPPLSTCGGLGAAVHSAPTIDERGDTVAMIVNDRTIRLYVVPHVDDEETKFEAHSIDHELDEEFGCPFSDIRWVRSPAALPAPNKDPSQVSGRLVVVSPGGVVDPSMVEESVADVEGGRIILFDFDPQYAGQPGQTFTLTLGKAPPQQLDEQEMDVAQEVALVRRRTVNKSQNIIQRGPNVGRAAGTVSRSASSRLAMLQRSQSINENEEYTPPGRLTSSATGQGQTDTSELSFERSDALTNVDEEAFEALEQPYDGNNPRSLASLERAASAADNHRIQRFQERAAESVSVRKDGFLPLPQYTEEPNAPLPGRYRPMAGLDQSKTMQTSPSSSTLSNTLARRPSGDALTSQPSMDAIVAGPYTRQENREGLSARTPQPPPGQNLPRSLQRAYSNAVSPITSNAGSPRIPQLRNHEYDPISPIVNNGTNGTSPAGSVNASRSNISQPSTVSPCIPQPAHFENRPVPGSQQQSQQREWQGKARKELDQQAEQPEREQVARERQEYRERPQERQRTQQDRDRQDLRNCSEQITNVEIAKSDTSQRGHEAGLMSKEDRLDQRRDTLDILNGTTGDPAPKRTRSTRAQIEQRDRNNTGPSTSSQSLQASETRMSNSNYAPIPVSTDPPPPGIAAHLPPRSLSLHPGPAAGLNRAQTTPNLISTPLASPSQRSFFSNSILPGLPPSRSPSTTASPFEANSAPLPHDQLKDAAPLVRSASTSTQSRRRNLQPHVVAMQDAFHSSNPKKVSSSLFPLNPHYRRHSAQTAGSVAHPIVDWRPPAPGGEVGSYEAEARQSWASGRPSTAPGGSDNGYRRRRKKSRSGSEVGRGQRKEQGKKCVVM